MGNRISKTFGDITTQYVPDAQGNTLGVYDLVSSLNSSSQTVKNYYLKEHHIFGSSRLGMEEKEQLLATYAPAGGPIILEPAEPFNPTRGRGSYSRLVGDKRYELSNHLGNVLGVVTDRKLVDTGNSTVLSNPFSTSANVSSWTGVNATLALDSSPASRMRISMSSSSLLSYGASTGVSLQTGRTYNVQMYIDPNVSSPVNFSVKTSGGAVVSQQDVTQAGMYTLTFVAPSTAAYTINVSAPTGRSIIRYNFLIDDLTVTMLQQDATAGFASLFKPDVVVRNEYYPFGMLIPRPGVTTNTSDYRYGFQGQEMDNEVKGEGKSINYTFRMHDPRVGRFFAADPLERMYPHYTPYSFAGNKVISHKELEGAEEYATYESYKLHTGDAALNGNMLNGNDGVWFTQDRINRADRWQNAMAYITRNNDVGKLTAGTVFAYAGDIYQASYSFKQVRDYYLWAQHGMDKKGFGSRWAKGASYLVDELADTFEATDNSFGSITTGRNMPRLGKLMKDLNVGIAKYAIGRFNSVLYGSEGYSVDSWYKWDEQFIWDEQIDKVAPSIYKKYEGTSALWIMNKISRQEYGSGFVSGKNIPSFSIFNTDLTDEDNGAIGRYNIPLYMLWTKEHEETAGKLVPEAAKEVKKASDGIDDYYEKNKL